MGAAVATLCCGGGVLAQTEPVPLGNVPTWVSNDDYPAEALHKNEEGMVRFELGVDATGKPVSCRIVESSGSPSLDATTCRVMVQRATFQPATDASGKARAGLWQKGVNWNSPKNAQRVKMPLTSFVQIQQLSFGSDGRIKSCTSTQTGELGYQMEGCFKADGAYVVGRFLTGRFRDGTLVMVATQHVDGDPPLVIPPTGDLPPYWTVERTFTVLPNGSISLCRQRESGKGVVPCETLQPFQPMPSGTPRQVRYETRWAFQPAK